MFTLIGNGIRHLAKQREEHYNILIIGLDNSGKTTLAHVLMGAAPPDRPAPSVGFKPFLVDQGRKKMKFLDVGGGRRIRSIWRNYFGEVHGFIYVVDSSDNARMGEARETFEREIVAEHIAGKPLVVLANKQDVEGAKTVAEIEEALNVKELASRNNIEAIVMPGITKHPENSPPHPSVLAAKEWIVAKIQAKYKTLHARVSKHIAEQEEIARKKRADTQRRLDELRAKRLKEEAEEKARAEEAERQRNESGSAAAAAAGDAHGPLPGALPPLEEKHGVRQPAQLQGSVSPLPPIHAIPGVVGNEV